MSIGGSVQGNDSIELKVVLVEKSFLENNEDVSLSLVTVVAQSLEKIASVKATLRRFSQRTVLSLYYRGIRCSAGKTVEYYRNLGTDSLWQARLMQEISPGQPKTAIDIDNEGKKTVLMVPSSMSISAFRDVIFHRLGVQSDKQHLMINNKVVKSRSQIRDHARHPNTSMVLLDEAECKIDLAMKYVNFSRRRIEPIHRTTRDEATSEQSCCEITSGLNIEGVCCTPSCHAFGQNTIYPVGLKVFDMCFDIALCPLCNNSMHITNAGFHNCFWRIQGVKQTGNIPHSIRPITRQTYDEYVRCDPSHGTVPGKWTKLMLQATPLGDYKQCAVCHSLIETDHFIVLSCGDRMHHCCYVAWKNLDSKCPACLQLIGNH